MRAATHKPLNQKLVCSVAAAVVEEDSIHLQKKKKMWKNRIEIHKQIYGEAVQYDNDI